MSYNIKYRTYNSLMAEIEDSLSKYAEQNLIDSSKYIKVAKLCNSRLGIKINPITETVVDIKNGIGKLPDDFKLFQEAYVCLEYSLEAKTLATSIEYESVSTSEELIPEGPCGTALTCDSVTYENPYYVRRKFSEEVYAIFKSKLIIPLKLTKQKYCYNCNERGFSSYYFDIIKENDCYYVKTNIGDGLIYFKYISELIDEEGNLLVLDNDHVNQYYEYAIMHEILSELWLNGIDKLKPQMEYTYQKLRIAKRMAENYVNQYDFKELKDVFIANRNRFYNKYFKNII